MVHRAVIALAVILPNQFPVSLLDDCGFEGHPRISQTMRREIELELLAGWCEVRRLGAEANEDISANGLAMDAPQAKLRSIEPGSHLARSKQASVKLVGPLMIRAHELHGRAPRVGAYPGTAMPAAVDERPDNAIGRAHEQDWVGTDLQRQIAAGLGQLNRMAANSHSR